jgi:hypothetical protein
MIMDSHFVESRVSNDISNGSLSSVPLDAQPYFKHGDIISAAAITELKDAIKSSMVVQGQDSAGEYRAAIDRWNQNGIKEAVRHSSMCSTKATISIFCFRQLLSSVNQRMTSQLASTGQKNGASMLLLQVVVIHSMELHRLMDL